MKRLLIFIILLSAPISEISAQQTDIVAFVNEDVITSHDLSEQIKILKLVGALPQNHQVSRREQFQIIDSLIIQQLKLQLIEQFNIVPPLQAIEGEYQRLAKALRVVPDGLEGLLDERGINFKAVEKLVLSNVGWQFYARRFASRAVPSEKDAHAAYQTALNQLSQKQYLMDEIFLQVTSILDDTAKRQQAENIIEQLQNGADFAILARNASDAASAVGGARGWVAAGDLPQEVVEILEGLSAGAVTAAPIRIDNGYSIIWLKDKKQPELDYQQILDYRIELFGSDEKSQLRASLDAEQDIVGCADMPKNHVTIQDFQDVAASDVPTDLQNQMVRLNQGERSDVFFYQGQWAILTLCARREQGTPPIDQEQIFNRIGFERLEQYVAQHLAQKRREAFIEIRL